MNNQGNPNICCRYETYVDQLYNLIKKLKISTKTEGETPRVFIVKFLDNTIPQLKHLYKYLLRISPISVFVCITLIELINNLKSVIDYFSNSSIKTSDLLDEMMRLLDAVNNSLYRTFCIINLEAKQKIIYKCTHSKKYDYPFIKTIVNQINTLIQFVPKIINIRDCAMFPIPLQTTNFSSVPIEIFKNLIEQQEKLIYILSRIKKFTVGNLSQIDNLILENDLFIFLLKQPPKTPSFIIHKCEHISNIIGRFIELMLAETIE